MLVLQENEVYFFDRDNSCFQVDGLRFPHHSDFKRHLTKTLLDGVSFPKSFECLAENSIFLLNFLHTGNGDRQSEWFEYTEVFSIRCG